jgi:hypothetical protein
MPRGQNFSKERWSELGKEGGKVSAIVRRDNALQKYLNMVARDGILAALRKCRADSWRAGYEARGKRGRTERGKSGVLRTPYSDGEHS